MDDRNELLLKCLTDENLKTRIFGPKNISKVTKEGIFNRNIEDVKDIEKDSIDFNVTEYFEREDDIKISMPFNLHDLTIDSIDILGDFTWKVTDIFLNESDKSKHIMFLKNKEKFIKRRQYYKMLVMVLIIPELTNVLETIKRVKILKEMVEYSLYNDSRYQNIITGYEHEGLYKTVIVTYTKNSEDVVKVFEGQKIEVVCI